MKKCNRLKICALFILATIQTLALNAAWPSICSSLGFDTANNFGLAYEIPEPGSILLLGLGAFALLRKKNRKG